MGMFDRVLFDIKLLPVSDAAKEVLSREEFQTKDWECAMTDLKISDDGRLLGLNFEYDTVPEDERPFCKGKKPEERTDLDKFIGAITRINERWEDLNYHGIFNFYTYSDSAGWFEFNAKFTDGNLENIERVVRAPLEQIRS